MASSQESRSIQSQLSGKISNNLVVVLEYEDQHHWDDEKTHPIEYPDKVEGGAQEKFYEKNSAGIGGSFKAALVYKFTIDKPQYWIFAWYSPPPTPDLTNKVFTKLVYDKKDINWVEIGNELDHSIFESTYTQGQATVPFTAPKYGISDFNATIKYALK